MQQLFLSQLILFLSLSTGSGILLHETKVDKMTVLVVAPSVVVAKKVESGHLLESMPHTHSEAGTLESNSREFRSKSPSVAPRRDRDEKYRLDKKVPRGYHLFDSYHLPLEAIA